MTAVFFVMLFCGCGTPSSGTNDAWSSEAFGMQETASYASGGEKGENKGTQADSQRGAVAGQRQLFYDTKNVLEVAADGDIRVLYHLESDEEEISAVQEVNGEVYYVTFNVVSYAAQLYGPDGKIDVELPDSISALKDKKELLFAEAAGAGKFVEHLLEQYTLISGMNPVVVQLNRDQKIYVQNKNRTMLIELDRMGRVVNEYGLRNRGTVVALNERYAVYSTVYGYYILDLNTRRTEALPEANEEVFRQVLALDGNMLYCSMEKHDEQYGSVFTLYRYDIAEQEMLELFALESKPGRRVDFSPIYQHFAVINNKCYYLLQNNHAMEWYCCDARTAEEEPQPVGMVCEYYGLDDFGEVIYDMDSVLCPQCGEKAIYQRYLENIRLGASVPAADAINAQLAQIQQEIVGYTTKAKEQVQASNQEEIASGAACPHITYSDVNLLDCIEYVNENYLSICFQGEIYRDGAHGMPTMDCYLFRADTGERVTIEELFPGTEEEFRALVAQYTVADWKSREDEYYHPYFGWDSEEEAYAEVYEDAAYNKVTLRFTKDALLVEWPPYQYGPYSAGYIEVPIPYESLQLRF